MIAAYAYNGSFEEVLELFDLMKNYNVRMNKVVGVSALQAAAYVGKLEKGIAIHEYVTQKGMMSHVLVATSLMTCRHAGLVEEGKRMFREMEERHEIDVEVEHYACMVDLLGKGGLFDEALEMVRRMSVKASVEVWGALFSCSRMHCNLWLSNAALCQLVKLEPINFSHYDQELRLREANDGTRMKKVLACSWIRVK